MGCWRRWLRSTGSKGTGNNGNQKGEPQETHVYPLVQRCPPGITSQSSRAGPSLARQRLKVEGLAVMALPELVLRLLLMEAPRPGAGCVRSATVLRGDADAR
jgi:hypothetical protein